MKKLSRAELMMLQIIKILGSVSGYNIKVYIERWGYKDWAEVGKTSIYSSLKKLESKGLVLLFIDTQKVGKGAIPKNYSLTETGYDVLKEEMISIIETSKNRSKSFDLVISSIQILDADEIIDAFKARINLLQVEVERVSKQYDEEFDCLPAGGKFLNIRIISSLKNEIEFAKTLLKSYELEGEDR